jgi:hypothetical protein
MWKSKIGEMPECDEDHPFYPKGYEEWLEKVMAEPWARALEDMVRWTGTWVGTEEAFFGELRMRVGEDVFSSPDFPSTVGRLDEYIEIAIDGFCERNLMVWHHGELTEEDLDHYDVPEWGPEKPILVCQGRSAERPEYFEAMCRFLVRGDELPLAVLIFTGEDRHFRRYREWSGDTDDLLGKLRRNSPNGDHVPMFFADCFRPEEHRSEPCFDSDRPFLLYPHDREGYLAFHKQMSKWAPVLKELGIGVSRRKQAKSYRSPKSGEVERRTTTRWTIEAPRWKKRDDLFVNPGVPAKDLVVMVHSWIAPRR